MTQLPRLSRAGHAAHCKRCLSGLPASQTDIDGSRLALAFYCIGSLDLLGIVEEQVSLQERNLWKQWLWEQQTHGKYGTGFRPSPFMTAQHISSKEQEQVESEYGSYDTPHIIMTYTALISLAILRDDFATLDRAGLLRFLSTCQREDGSFSTVPGSNESDLRTLYCAFAISSMLNDWSGVNVPRAISFINTCRTYEGGYGQSPFCEAQGGTTYIALASLKLASDAFGRTGYLTPSQQQETVQWLLRNQASSGGFCGRTGKDADACYCFWCGAALKILGAEDLVDSNALASFLGRCQFKYGGISKAPGENPDPYHTYLSLAALAMYPPHLSDTDDNARSWRLDALDPLLNAREETTLWIRRHIPVPSNGPS
ncbi:hypothetical protein HYPSUDRAFT_39125 [Hypholoma sublateritium FD-334 SS-4]|uniref:Prenyltransferase alpha-alpha toroid domain-containing protein n=1 Tax=Hypholoma sublateritium (strain FD-334 SS-4) TaxID=945553 RepID=A0A0D2PX27_HYPSF|nr:hypothetical protein HYPSUDRAFT_39125 [Hypholoma sublateritium FD-334 SS-4]